MSSSGKHCQHSESMFSRELIEKTCPRGLNRSSMNDDDWCHAPFDEQCIENMFRMLKLMLKRYNDWEEIAYTIVYVIISVLAIIGNGLVILAVIRRKEMRTDRNVFIVNLAISNLMLAIINIPFLWLPSLDFEFNFPTQFCKFANALPGSNVYCSTLTISAMAIDRYYSVKQMPITSDRHRRFRAITISFGIWIVSFLLSFPLLVYYDTSMIWVFRDITTIDTTTNEIKVRSFGWQQCKMAIGQDHNSNIDSSNDNITESAISLAVSLLQVLFLYIVPLVVLSVFNAKLTRFLNINSRHINANRNRMSLLGEDHQQQQQPINKSNFDYRLPSIINGRMLSNGSIIAQTRKTSEAVPSTSDRRRSRTTSLLIAMAASYALLWLPFIVVTVILDLGIVDIESSPAIIERLDQSCKMISIMSICVNPFLYGFLNTNFKHEFNDIFRTWIRCLPSSTVASRRIVGDYNSSIGAVMSMRHASIISTDNNNVSSGGGGIRAMFGRFRSISAGSVDTPSYRPSRINSVRTGSYNRRLRSSHNQRITTSSLHQRHSPNNIPVEHRRPQPLSSNITTITHTNPSMYRSSTSSSTDDSCTGSIVINSPPPLMLVAERNDSMLAENISTV